MTKLIDIRGLNTSEAGTSGTTIRRGFRGTGTVPASLTTALAGANNDLKYVAKAGGTGGNAITINYTDPGGATASLGVVRTGNAIVVNLGRAASAINTTATALKAAIDASVDVAATAVLTSNNTNVTAATPASIVLTTDNTEVVDGDTVTVGAVTYRFKDTPAAINDVKRNGTTADTTLLNLARAINGTGTPGTEYFTGTVANPAATASSSVTAHTITITAIDAGTAGNALAATETSIHLDFAGAGTTFAAGTVRVAGDTITVGGKVYEFYPAVTGPNNVANRVLKGADADTSLLNLARAINHGGTPGTEYAALTTANADATSTATVTAHAITLTSTAVGTAGNTTASTETAVTLSFGAATFANGADGASDLAVVTNAPGNSGAGLVTALATTNLAGGGASGNALINNQTTTQVDLDVPAQRKILAKYVNEWVTVPDGGNLIYIRSLGASQVADAASIISRGFRITNSAGVPKDLVPAGAAVRVDLDDPLIRKALKEHYSRWIVANNSDSLVTIRGLTTSGASGYTITRGFRIKNQAGTQVAVTPNTDVQVNVSDAYVRRILRRNIGRYVVVSTP